MRPSRDGFTRSYDACGRTTRRKPRRPRRGCGHGIFGRTVAAEAAAAGRDVVVIETDDQTAEEYLVVDGDVRRESVLADAGVERATTLVAAIDDSNVNVQIALVAEELAPTVTTIGRVADATDEDLARRARADRVVVPEVLSGRDVAGAFDASTDGTSGTGGRD
jgi:voltage-gated potassium channel